MIEKLKDILSCKHFFLIGVSDQIRSIVALQCCVAFCLQEVNQHMYT